MGTGPDERDKLDDSLDVWVEQIPGLDRVTEGIVERIQKLARAFDRSMDETLAESGLDRRSYYVLGKLRRVGPPFQLSAGELAEQMRISSGTMTHRLDKMERAGLVRRLPDPDDRRGTLIEPTDLGHETWDRTAGTQADRESAFAAVLDVNEREELHRLLRSLMRAFPDAVHLAPHREDGP